MKCLKLHDDIFGVCNRSKIHSITSCETLAKLQCQLDRRKKQTQQTKDTLEYTWAWRNNSDPYDRHEDRHHRAQPRIGYAL